MPAQPLARPRSVLTALLLVAATLACGRKGDPQPPPSRVPAPPQDVQVEQRGEEIILAFLFPTTTIGGLALEAFEAVEIYELVREVPAGFFDEPLPAADAAAPVGEDTIDDGPGTFETPVAEPPGDPAPEDPTPEESQADPTEEVDDADDADEADKEEKTAPRRKVYSVAKSEFAAGAQVRLRLEGTDLSAAIRGDRIATRFQLQEITEEPLTAHVFGVRIIRDDELSSPYSDFATLIPRPPPPPPTDLAVDATPDGVRLQWQSDTVAQPLDDDRATGERSKTADPDAEDPDAADPDAADPEMELAVGTPDGDELAAAAADMPAERRILGFHIYRRTAREPEFDQPLQRIGPTARRFLDTSATYGTRYVYAVTAIRELPPDRERHRRAAGDRLPRSLRPTRASQRRGARRARACPPAVDAAAGR